MGSTPQAHPPQCPLVFPSASQPGLGLGRDPGAVPRRVLGIPGGQGQGTEVPTQRPSRLGACPEPGVRGAGWGQHSCIWGARGRRSRLVAPGPSPSLRLLGVGPGSPPAVGLPGGSWAEWLCWWVCAGVEFLTHATSPPAQLAVCGPSWWWHSPPLVTGCCQLHMGLQSLRAEGAIHVGAGSN